MSNREHGSLLLEQAATAAMARIRSDGAKAPEKLKVLFTYLEGHLFDKTLDVNAMKRACGKRDNSVSGFFANVAGVTPYAYIVARRLETAAALLRDTHSEIRLISKLVGFSKHAILIRHFKACYGMTPKEFRLVAVKTKLGNARECSLSSAPEIPTPQKHLAVETLRFTREDVEKIPVEELWEVLRVKPWADQKGMVRYRLAFSRPIFFHFLRNKGILEGRDNRQFGVHLTELAIECLRVTELINGKDLFDLRAQGWVWAGNARRLADDLNGAEAAFSIAAMYLPRVEEVSLVRAEFYDLKSRLRLWQGRTREAFNLHCIALPLFRAIGKPREIATSLIAGAYTCERSGNDQESIARLREALQLLNCQGEPYLMFAACLNLTTSYVRTGALKEAKEMLPRVRELRQEADAGVASHHFLQWLEGRIADNSCEFSSAARSYQAAQDGFLQTGQHINAALVALDFALLCYKQGKLAQAQELVLMVTPLLEAVQFQQEAAAALKLLQSAMAEGSLSGELLQKARTYIEKIQLTPWT